MIGYRTFFLLSCLGMATHGRSQVPVYKEPMHHLVFQNNFVRILDVHVPPGDTTLFHKHETPSVFIRIKNAKTGSEVIMEEQQSPVLVGNDTLSFEGFYSSPRVHRVWNSDATAFHVMDVELLSRHPKAANTHLSHPDVNLLIDAKPVWVYQVDLKNGARLRLRSANPLLVIALTECGHVSVNTKRFQQASQFLFVPAGKQAVFSNSGKERERLAIPELK